MTRYITTLSFHLPLFPNTTLFSIRCFALLSTCPNCSIRCAFINCVVDSFLCRSCSSRLFLLSHIHPSFFPLNNFLSIFRSHIPNLYVSAQFNIKVSHPYVTIGRNIVLYTSNFTFRETVFDSKKLPAHLSPFTILPPPSPNYLLFN